MADDDKPGQLSARRKLAAVVAGAGAWTVLLTGLAPAAAGQDAQSQQWYLGPMKAEQMWKVSTGKGIKVAVIDSGVDGSTSSLRGQVLPGKDISGAPGGTGDDVEGHGTAVAELIAGTGRAGSVKGLAPGAKIVPYRLNLGKLKGEKKHKIDPTASALFDAADSDVQIINMSVASEHTDNLQNAVKYAAKKGKILFASSGNSGKKGNGPEYPVSYKQVAGVGAYDKEFQAAEFSTNNLSVDLSAAGVAIPGWCSEDRSHYCQNLQGTSYATALASASAALLWSKHPEWNANQVLRVLFKTASPPDGKAGTYSRYVGRGGIRPRMNLLEGKGDPGNPKINPLTGKKLIVPALDPNKARALAAEKQAKENQDEGKSAGSDSSDDGAPDKVKVADSSSGDSGSTAAWVAGGVGAVIVLGAVAFGVARRRRS